MATASSRPSPPKPHERARGVTGTFDDALIPASGRNQLVRSARDTLDLNRDSLYRNSADQTSMTPYERERSLASGLTGGYNSNSTMGGGSLQQPRIPPRTGLSGKYSAIFLFYINLMLILCDLNLVNFLNSSPSF